MGDINICLSINLIRERIDRIAKVLDDKKNKQVDEVYYYESLRINLVEIGEESKKINDFLLKKEGKWNDIISKEYNLRISLTHYYANIHNKIIDKHICDTYLYFVDKIDKLEKKYCLGGNN